MENPVRGHPKFSKVIPRNLAFQLGTLPERRHTYRNAKRTVGMSLMPAD